MKQLTVKIVDPIGLHARPSSKLVDVANKFKSTITIHLDGKEGNVKSVISLMGIGARCNNEITFKATGSDEDQAIEAINQVLVEQKLI